MTNLYSWERPKLKIPRTKSEWVLDVIGYSFFLGSIIFLVVFWGKLPEEVPGHYNEFGEVTRWGSKWELIILPVFEVLLVLFLQIFERFPELYNYPKRFNKSNAKHFYLTGRMLVNQMKNVAIIIFTFLLYENVSVALEWSNGFGVAFLPIAIIFLVVPAVIGIMKSRKIK